MRTVAWGVSVDSSSSLTRKSSASDANISSAKVAQNTSRRKRLMHAKFAWSRCKYDHYMCLTENELLEIPSKNLKNAFAIFSKVIPNEHHGQ